MSEYVMRKQYEKLYHLKTSINFENDLKYILH